MLSIPAHDCKLFCIPECSECLQGDLYDCEENNNRADVCLSGYIIGAQCFKDHIIPKRNKNNRSSQKTDRSSLKYCKNLSKKL